MVILKRGMLSALELIILKGRGWFLFIKSVYGLKNVWEKSTLKNAIGEILNS